MRSEYLIARGRSLDIVTQAEVIEPYRLLREDLRRITYGYYLAELMDQFTAEGEESHLLYALLRDALGWVCTSRDLTLTGRSYEIRLLEYSGYRPEFARCVRCESLVGETDCFFDPARGGSLCLRCGQMASSAVPLSLRVLQTLRTLQDETYARCSGIRIEKDVRDSMEEVMHTYLTHLLERRLKSVEFLGALRRMG